MPPETSRVTCTYSELHVLQFQDIDEFFDKAGVQDSVQMFLSRVGVNYSDSHTVSQSSFSQAANFQTN